MGSMKANYQNFMPIMWRRAARFRHKKARVTGLSLVLM